MMKKNLLELKEIKKIEGAKSCPFCGKLAKIIINRLWNDSHGYYGCFGVFVACQNSECKIKPRTKEYDTIYENDIEKQMQKAINDWNERVDPRKDAQNGMD